MVAGGPSGNDAALASLRVVESRHIQRVLEHVGWNKQRAARVLQINRGTLYRKIAEYGLVREASPFQVRVDPIGPMPTDSDHDQRDTRSGQNESESIGQPRLPRKIPKGEDDRARDEAGPDKGGKPARTSQA